MYHGGGCAMNLCSTFVIVLYDFCATYMGFKFEPKNIGLLSVNNPLVGDMSK